MTMFTLSSPSAMPRPFRGFAERAVKWVLKPVDKLTTALAERRTIGQLNKLDDRMLGDIGISRAEIQSIAHGIGKDPARPRHWLRGR